MNSNQPDSRPFHEGEEVVLAEGTYKGTPGVFLHLRGDPNWADITEADGSVRNHPIVWLAHRSAVGSGCPA
jgi:hypothetical protein